MNLKNWIKRRIFNESVKEIELNRILDKISSKKSITEREKRYLDLYHHTNRDDMQDYVFLSKSITHKKIADLLSKNKVIFCDLTDRDGKIGRKIVNIVNSQLDEKSILYLDNETKFNLEDRFLYNIIYNNKKDIYSLQVQDEYFEKIMLSND